MSSGRLVALTGATGFIGSHLARRLAARADRLRCYVRPSSPPERTRALEQLGAELVRGELEDVAALAAALAGADVAYHLAGIYRIGVVDAGALERVNVGGTLAFLDAVERADTPLAVHVSTTAALGPLPAGRGDESTEHGPRFPSVYERTKAESHRLARAAQARGIPVVIACPANVYGPGDEGPNAGFISDLVRGRLPGLPSSPAWFSYVHVDDVADGLLLLGLRGRPGETYVLSGEERSLNEFAVEVARLAGRNPPALRLPAGVLAAAGSLMDAIARLTGVSLTVTREGAATTASGQRYLHSHEKATRELGWQPRPLSEGLPETVTWFRQRAGAGRA